MKFTASLTNAIYHLRNAFAMHHSRPSFTSYLSRHISFYTFPLRPRRNYHQCIRPFSDFFASYFLISYVQIVYQFISLAQACRLDACITFSFFNLCVFIIF